MSGTETVERTARKKAVVRVAPEEVLADLGQPVRRAVAPALEVGGVHDAAEHEADRLADRVVARLRAQEAGADAADGAPGHTHHGHAPGVAHRSPAPAPAVPVTVGREGGSAGPELTSTIESMRGGGQALDPGIRRSMGEAFGRDLSGVRVHTDGRAAAAAAQMGAVAFTTGRDIFFGAGQYSPDTDAGRHVLAHELAHTVQQEGSTRRKVSRLWDLKAPGPLRLETADTIIASKDHPVWIFQDRDGDKMVVKVEETGIGLGDLVGQMQAHMTGARTVTHRKLTRSEAGFAGDLMGMDFAIDWKSWTARGKYVKSQSKGAYDGEDDVEAARMKALEDLAKPVMAMSWAGGDQASSLAAAPDAASGTKFRAILSKPGHVRKLGEMSAVDLFMGNQDRVTSGNLGNWFYDPSGAMTVIDNVDSGNSAMADDWMNGTDPGNDVALSMLSANVLKNTAVQAVQYLGIGMEEHGGDTGAVDWLKEVMPSGKTRKAEFADEFLAGLQDGKQRLIKTFSATRFKGRSADRKAKKALKKVAAASGATDESGHDYYEYLKARALWLKKR